MSINGVNTGLSATAARIVGAITKGDLSAAIKALPEGVQRSFEADAGMAKFKQITAGSGAMKGVGRFGDAAQSSVSTPEKVAAFLLKLESKDKNLAGAVLATLVKNSPAFAKANEMFSTK